MPLIQDIQAVLTHHPRVKLAIVFGSMASGRPRPHSDLDLAVAADTELSVKEKERLIEDLAMVSERPVDLVDLQTAGEPILHQVLTKGEIVYSWDSGLHGELIKRMLFDHTDFAPYRERILAERRKAWIGR